MSEPYLEGLKQMVRGLELPKSPEVTLESKHFFSGAALYANGIICALFSPTGFAVKLPEDMRVNLLEKGVGAEYRFFADGPVKGEYVALADSIIQDDEALQNLIGASVNYVTGRPGLDEAI